MGPFTSFTFEMASLAAKVVQRQLKQNEFLEAHILCYHNKSLAALKIKLFAEYHHVIYLKQLEGGWHGEPRLRRLRSISIAPPTRH